MKYLTWLLKAAIFFTLFAFALNNQQAAEVKFFFGTVWRMPMVLVVLVAFAVGLALGVFVMLPGWWRRRHPGAPSPHTAPGELAPFEKISPQDINTIRRHGI